MDIKIQFNREVNFEYGEVSELSSRIRRVIARNPSPFTLYGTGTYIIGSGNIAIVDPGPADDRHIGALLEATKGETITHILITHTHMDHSPGCRLLAEVSDAPTYAYGPHGAGKLEQGITVEEGGDMDFVPDVIVSHGQVIQGEDWSVECVYTPGHTSNHVCYQLREEKTLFSGDHVMGWSTSIVSPPDGDMKNYIQSLELLLARNDAIYWPTHGPAIANPKPYVRAFISHRMERERQILASLEQGVHKIYEMVPTMYTGLSESMYPAAARSVFASMVYMVDRGEVVCDEQLAVDASYRKA